MTAPRFSRDPNLDLLRATAILLVLGYHTHGMWPGEHKWKFLSILHIGEFGVDLFFVLSGWLIGGLFWAEQRKFGDVEIGRFLCRRWLRTVPPYFVILPLAWLGTYLARREPFDLSYLFFLQNYRDTLAFFQVSWSLCVEEHFYLVLPFLLTTVRLLRLPVPIVLSLLAALPFINRITLDESMVPESYAFGYYRMATHFRFEGLVLGVLCAWTSQYRPDRWAQIQRVARWLAWPSVALFLSMAWWSWYWLVYPGYTLIALIFTTWLAAVAGQKPVLIATNIWTYRIALWSYSLYLTHSMVIHVCRTLQGRLDFIPWPVWLMVWFTAILLVGRIYCDLVEKPAINLRDRWAPRRPKKAKIDPPDDTAAFSSDEPEDVKAGSNADRS